MLAKIVMQCEKSSDLITLKIVQSERAITELIQAGLARSGIVTNKCLHHQHFLSEKNQYDILSVNDAVRVIL